jgi:integrase
MADARTLEKTKEPGVYKRGDSYIVHWKHRGQSHKRYFARFSEAREFKRTLHGAAKQPTTRETVIDYYEKWIDSYRGRTARGLEETTRDEYRRSFELHVRPYTIGRERMRDVTSRDVSDWFTELERASVKPPSIRKAKAALSAMLATAAQAGDIQANPAIGVRYVPVNAQPKRQRRTLTVEDVDAIPLEPRAGMAAVLRVARSVGLPRRRAPRPDVGPRPPGRRSPPVHHRAGLQGRAQTAQDGRQRTHDSAVSAHGPGASGLERGGPVCAPDRPVFASAVGTALNYSNVYNRVLIPALKACGLDGQGVAFHAFRKACGSMLLKRAGKDLRQVQRWLGHSQLTTTMNVYVHDLDDGLGGADALDALWGHPGATEHPQTAANGSASGEQNPAQEAEAADSREALT